MKIPATGMIFLILILLSLVSPAGGQEADPDSVSDQDGWGSSYWGHIPAPQDSVTAAFSNLPMPLWEGVLVWPFRVITFPIKAVGLGIGAGVTYMDHSRWLYRIGQLLAGPEVPIGVYPTVSASSLSGLGLGLTLFHNTLPLDTRMRFSVKASTRGSRRYTLGFMQDRASAWEIGAGHRYKPNARFFGIGPHTREEDETFYTLEQNWVGLAYNHEVSGNLAIEPGALFSAVGAREADDDFDPSLETRFPGTAGFGETIEGITLSLHLIHDTTPLDGRPQGGGLGRLKVARFLGFGEEETDYTSYRAELQRYFPLWFTKRALALRGFASWLDSRGNVIPFQYLLTNDEPDLFRGYRDFRWRDRGMVAGSLEYRWPIWAPVDMDGFGVDAFLFSDIGQVFGGGGEIALRNLTFSYGGGLRMVGSKSLTGLLEFGWSKEDFQLRLTGHQVFDPSRGRLLRGRPPIPTR
jgi:hypothetical protein